MVELDATISSGKSPMTLPNVQFIYLAAQQPCPLNKLVNGPPRHPRLLFLDGEVDVEKVYPLFAIPFLNLLSNLSMRM